MKNEPIITLDAITVRLRDKVYLRNTSWQIKSEENWAVIGPNGAGKTTLAKSLFGNVPVVGGRITHHYGTEDSEPVYHFYFIRGDDQNTHWPGLVKKTTSPDIG